MIALIVAIASNNAIGLKNDLPWHYPEDLKYFKQMTFGKAVFMGHNTYMSIYNRLGKSLPGRTNYVLTHSKGLPGDNIIVTDYHQFLSTFKDDLFIIGGRSVYELTLPYVEYLYITRIKKDYPGDVFFPTYSQTDFSLINYLETSELVFEVYQRIK